MDDEEWAEYSNVNGSNTCLNGIVVFSEKLTGAKFKVTYDSVGEIRAGKATMVTRDDAPYGGTDAVLIAVMAGSALINGELEISKDGRLKSQVPETQVDEEHWRKDDCGLV